MSLECSNDCGSCQEECASRTTSKESFLAPANEYSNVKKVIGVVSGKGGVGKSFVTSYLSVLLRRKGYQTAILDADITGPSIPKAFGIHEKAKGSELGIYPAETKTGIKVMSCNLLLETEDTPVIWRGPVIAGTVKQFWSDVMWGDVDYMFVDMPPGTGDVPLTVFQSLPLDGIIIVTSPQELVSMIVAKAVNMAKAMDIPILGLVENYSYITCGDCGNKISVFGESHVEETANTYGLEVLGQVPIDPAIAKAVDGESIEDLNGEWLVKAVNKLEKDAACEKTSGAQKSGLQGKVRIAVTTDENHKVFQHFGKSEQFTIYELVDATLVDQSVLSSDGQGHGALADLLAGSNIDVLICGGIGEGALNKLSEEGIRVISGMEGDIDVVVAACLDDGLSAAATATCGGHSHDHHGHEHHSHENHDHDHHNHEHHGHGQHLGEGCGGNCGNH